MKMKPHLDVEGGVRSGLVTGAEDLEILAVSDSWVEGVRAIKRRGVSADSEIGW